MMKILTLTIALCFPLLLHAQKEDVTSLKNIIPLINNSLDQANADLETSDLDIQSATITLKTTYAAEGGGGFKLFVKASKSWEIERANTVTFYYVKSTEKSADFTPKKFVQNLTTAIVTAAKEWQAATTSINGLHKDSLSVSLSFSATKVTEAGIEFEVFGVGVDGGGKFENRANHTITLSFK